MHIKKLIAGTVVGFLGFSSVASAAVNDVIIQQKDGSNVTVDRTLPNIPNSGFKILTINTTDGTLEFLSAGTGLQLDDSGLEVQNIHISDIQDLSAALDGKAAQNTMDTALAGKAPISHTHEISEISNLSLFLSGKVGTTTMARKLQADRVTTDANGNYTWTYPISFPASTTPRINAVVETTSGTIPYNVQIMGTPSATSTTFKVLRSSTTSVLGIIVLGEPVGTQAVLHVMAVEP